MFDNLHWYFNTKVHKLHVITHADGYRTAGFIGLFVRLFFRTISQKPMQLGSPNLTYKCSTISPGDQFILGSKGQISRSWVKKKHCRRESLHSCECWLLLAVLVHEHQILVLVLVPLVLVLVGICYDTDVSMLRLSSDVPRYPWLVPHISRSQIAPNLRWRRRCAADRTR